MFGMYADTVTRVRAALTADKYGNTTRVRDWAGATSQDFSGVAVQPHVDTETVGDRSTTVTSWYLYTRPGVDMDLLASDRLVFQGDTYEVSGEVERHSLNGAVHHIEARIQKVVG